MGLAAPPQFACLLLVVSKPFLLRTILILLPPYKESMTQYGSLPPVRRY
jgi:hypothetical protein